MPVYDWNGTNNTPIGAIYDWDETSASKIGAINDWDGTAAHSIYTSELNIFNGGSVYQGGSWGGYNPNGAYTTGYFDNNGIYLGTTASTSKNLVSGSPVDLSGINTLQFQYSQWSNNALGYNSSRVLWVWICTARSYSVAGDWNANGWANVYPYITGVTTTWAHECTHNGNSDGYTSSEDMTTATLDVSLCNGSYYIGVSTVAGAGNTLNARIYNMIGY